MEEKNTKVSVVITAYNVEKYIEKAINSVLNQTYKDIELVVVEDCSTDNTLKIIKDLQKSDTTFSINLVQHLKNVGAGLSRRDGIKASTGDFIMLLDADDWLNEDYIEHLHRIKLLACKLIKMLSEHSEVYDKDDDYEDEDYDMRDRYSERSSRKSKGRYNY